MVRVLYVETLRRTTADQGVATDLIEILTELLNSHERRLAAGHYRRRRVQLLSPCSQDADVKLPRGRLYRFWAERHSLSHRLTRVTRPP